MGEESQGSVGSGDDDWWTSYPDQSPAVGSGVNHPDWVLDALKESPVLIYIHKDCTYCKPQSTAVANVSKDLGQKLAYYEIAADGSDSRAEEALMAYDPNGDTTYVPMTVILTLARGSDGNVVPVWHSTEDVTGEDWVSSWAKGAIELHDENAADWKS